MSFKVGIVGLPNVGKSTMFNALTKSKNAEAANFPFCTIEPNVGVVSVPDERIEKISKIAISKKTIPTLITFVDIAGLVAGASKGEGLGNKFLSHIREVDAIVHLLRCFESDEIQNVNKTVDPVRDFEIIETELMLADLESLEKRIGKKNKNVVENEDLNKLLEQAYALLKDGKNPYNLRNDFDSKIINSASILTLKPKIIVCNTGEDSIVSGNQYTKLIEEHFKREQIVNISAEIEQQITELGDSEASEFMKDLNIQETGLDRVIRSSYKALDLSTYFTAGPEETRAWTIPTVCKAPDAAEVIHTDFKKGFIKVETIGYEDFIQCKGESGARDKGKLRIEGKDYLVKDGDVLHFRFNT
ncbi:redox-regulated ATPase YchF [Pelagibacteraceae bacterium]|nr:redox-regulated ATPase YchF [Pelagibacteraceae bacterium]